MRITTWNVNGLRAAIKKGMGRFVEELAPDALLLQEIRCTPDQLPKGWTPPCNLGPEWHAAAKPGWSGVATFSKAPITRLGVGMEDLSSAGAPAGDPEGRILRVRVGPVQLVNVYLPSGSAGPEAQERKEAWMARFLPWAARIAASSEPVVLCGDLNIAHTPLDVHNPRTASKISGFLPHEREWFTALLASGWTDCVRKHVGDHPGPYSWWSNFGKARELDRGWRIDHVLANAAAAPALRAASVHRAAGLQCSDHAPVSVDFDFG